MTQDELERAKALAAELDLNPELKDFIHGHLHGNAFENLFEQVDNMRAYAKGLYDEIWDAKKASNSEALSENLEEAEESCSMLMDELDQTLKFIENHLDD
jgi:hypothetical protein